MNGEPVSEKKIREFIKRQRAWGTKLEAVIAADRDTSHGRVVGLIDLVRSEGVTKFAINVLKRSK